MTMPEAGTLAPDFTAPSDGGADVTLSALRGRWVVVYFYPRDNTPGCTIEAQEFRDLYPSFRKRNAEVLGISADSVKSHCGFRDKFALTFPLLSDPDRTVLQAWGAYGPKVMYGKQTLGILRSTFLVGPDGRIARAWPRVKVAGHAAEVLAAIPT